MGHLHLAVDPSSGLGDAQGPVFQVKVIPEERHQFATPDTRGQFQVEHRQDAMFRCGGKVGADFLRWEGAHLLLFLGRELAPGGGVVGSGTREFIPIGSPPLTGSPWLASSSSVSQTPF